MTATTFLPINAETGEYCARGHEFDNHADAYIAALTDGEGVLERDGDGYMRALENGKQIYTGGSFNKDDQVAKDEVVREIGRNLNTHDYRYTTLKIERDDGGSVVRIDDDDSSDLIAYWNRRVGAVCCEGRHIGVIKEINAQFVVQDKGRGEVVNHDVALFAVVPKVGEVIDVQYKGGKAVVAETKNNGKSNER